MFFFCLLLYLFYLLYFISHAIIRRPNLLYNYSQKTNLNDFLAFNLHFYSNWTKWYEMSFFWEINSSKWIMLLNRLILKQQFLHTLSNLQYKVGKNYKYYHSNKNYSRENRRRNRVFSRKLFCSSIVIEMALAQGISNKKACANGYLQYFNQAINFHCKNNISFMYQQSFIKIVLHSCVYESN